MAFENSVNVRMIAGAAVRKGQFVKISSTKVIPCSSQGENAFGVAEYDAAADGDEVTVCVQGACAVEVNSASVVVGSYITTSTGGAAEPAASGDFVLGRALEAGSAASGGLNEYIRVVLDLSGFALA